MRAVGRTDPNTRRELRFLCTAASCTLSAPAVIPPHKPIIDHTSPTFPRGPIVSKRPRQSVGRPRGPMRITSRLHSHSLWTHIVQGCRRWRAQQSKSFPTSTCTFVRAPGYAGRIVASAVLVVAEGGGCGPSGASAADPQGAPLGGADASSQLGQRNSTSEACRCQMCVAFECGCPSRTPPS